MQPSLNLLRTFDAVGRHLSFRAGAEELHITASAVSHQIRDLETQLGLPLFVRRHRQIAFTAEGAAYHAAISRALADIRRATQVLQGEEDAAPLRVSAMPFVATDILAPAIGRFLAQWPALRIDIQAETRSMDVAGGDTDVAIRFGYVMHDQTIPLAPAEVTLLCAPSLADAVRADPHAAAQRYPLYSMTDHRELWTRWFEYQQWPDTFRETISLNSYRGLLMAAARDGLALGLLPVVTPLVQSGVLAAPLPARRMPLAHFSLEVREAVRWRPEVVALVSWLRALFSDCVRDTDEYFSSRVV